MFVLFVMISVIRLRMKVGWMGMLVMVLGLSLSVWMIGVVMLKVRMVRLNMMIVISIFMLMFWFIGWIENYMVVRVVLMFMLVVSMFSFCELIWRILCE